MKRRKFIQLTGAGLAATSLPAVLMGSKTKPVSASDRPNIVVIMTDQQRGDYSRLAGFPLDTQPFVDSLARQGTRFEHAYTTAPLCVPARCSLHTGRFPKAHRVRENSGGKHVFFQKDLVTVLKEQGYYLGLSGKNHSYLKADDFDYFRQYGHWRGYVDDDSPAYEKEFDEWVFALEDAIGREPTPFPLQAQHPYRMVSRAREFVDGAGDRPFFLWLSFPEPHNPYQVPKPYFDMFPPDKVPERLAGPEALADKSYKWRWQRRLVLEYLPDYKNLWRLVRSNYCGMLRLIDDQVRRFVDYLEEKDLWKNTILVFLADHGDFVGDYGLHKKGVEMPECLVRIPMVWCGPGIKTDVTRHPALVSIADVMPTLCEAIGVELPLGVQGRSLWPLLTGRPYPKEEFASVYAENGTGGLYFDETDDLSFDHMRLKRPVNDTFNELNSYSQAGSLKMVRKGDWKLLSDMMGSGQLYNLRSDPAEVRNLFGISKYADVQAEMVQELLTWTIRTEDSLPTNRYIHKWPERNWYASHR